MDLQTKIQNLINELEADIQKYYKEIRDTMIDDEWIRGKISAKRLIIKKLNDIIKSQDNEIQ